MNGKVRVFYGDGKGKSTAALGTAVGAASHGKSVIIIQFLKERNDEVQEFVKRLEPEIRFFRFEKSEVSFENLTEEEQHDAVMNMKNGINYAKKVLTIGECDVLILDEALGLVDENIISAEELVAVVEAKAEETELIFTGRVLKPELAEHADEIYHITAEKC